MKFRAFTWLLKAVCVMCLVTAFAHDSEAAKPKAKPKVRDISKLRCAKSGVLETVLRPLPNIAAGETQKVTFDARVACKGKKKIVLRPAEVRKYLGKRWGIVCEDPAGNRSVLAEISGGVTASASAFSSTGQWACRIVSAGRKTCESSLQTADQPATCKALKKKLKKLKTGKLTPLWTAFTVVGPGQPTGGGGPGPGGSTPAGPTSCADLCAASTAPATAQASLVFGPGLHLQSCQTANLGYSLVGATRKSGQKALVCVTHPNGTESYELNPLQEPGSITLTYVGNWTFSAIVETDKGVVCTAPATFSVADSGAASCLVP